MASIKLKNLIRSANRDRKILESFFGYSKVLLENDGSGFSKIALNGKPLSISVKKQNSTIILKESKTTVFENKGGIIFFSTDINVHLNKNDLIEKISLYFKDKWQSVLNKIFVNKKINAIIQKERKDDEKIYGITLGKFLKGQYYSPSTNKKYSKSSWSIEIIGISSNLLEIIGSELAKEFHQESVLVKDYMTNEFYLCSSQEVKNKIQQSSN